MSDGPHNFRVAFQDEIPLLDQEIRASAAKTVISLLLHDVTDRPETSGFSQPTAMRYKHSVAQFRSYLDVVEESGLPVATPDSRGSHPGETAEGSVVFTFDDGGSAAGIAADLLEERGWRGMFFITTNLIGSRAFMSAAQITELHERGHVIGSHSCSHPDVFRDLSIAQMQEEWRDSREELQQLLGTEITTVSVPGGDISRETISEAAEAGYEHIFTSEQLTRPWQQAGTQCYGRLMMLNTTSPETLRRWLRHPALGILPERLLRFTKSRVKKLMGPFYLQLMKRRRALHEDS